MKLFSGKIGIIAAEITRALVDNGDLETDSPGEVDQDIQAVLHEYIRTDRELTEKAKDMCEERGMPLSTFMKVKRSLALQRGFGVGDESVDYIMDQLIRTFMNSPFVDEVYSDDQALKRQMRPVIRRHTEIEDDLDREARTKIKNLQEGTQDWEIEYARAMAQVKRRRGL